MNEKTEQIQALMADEAFVKSCIEAENEEAVQKLFADKGVEMSLTEIELMKEMVCAVAEGKVTEADLEKLSSCGELTEDELEEAAGGDLYEFFHIARYVGDNCAGWELRTGRIAGLSIVGGLLVAGGAAYGICKACGVDVEEGIKSAYNWVADKVTSRW